MINTSTFSLAATPASSGSSLRESQLRTENSTLAQQNSRLQGENRDLRAEQRSLEAQNSELAREVTDLQREIVRSGRASSPDSTSGTLLDVYA